MRCSSTNRTRVLDFTLLFAESRVLKGRSSELHMKVAPEITTWCAQEVFDNWTSLGYRSRKLKNRAP